MDFPSVFDVFGCVFFFNFFESLEEGVLGLGWCHRSFHSLHNFLSHVGGRFWEMTPLLSFDSRKSCGSALSSSRGRLWERNRVTRLPQGKGSFSSEYLISQIKSFKGVGVGGRGWKRKQQAFGSKTRVCRTALFFSPPSVPPLTDVFHHTEMNWEGWLLAARQFTK